MYLWSDMKTLKIEEEKNKREEEEGEKEIQRSPTPPPPTDILTPHKHSPLSTALRGKHEAQ